MANGTRTWTGHFTYSKRRTLHVLPTRHRLHTSQQVRRAILRRRDQPSRRCDAPAHDSKQKEAAVKLQCSLVLALVICVAATPFAAATDSNVGHWKLNPEKSKGAVFKSGTVDIEAHGDGVKTSVDLVKTDGTPSRWSFTANYDGKDSPITGDCPFGNAVTLTRVDTHTTRGTTKQDGKVTIMQTAVISAD